LRAEGAADEIAHLKREPGKETLAHGGAQFARSLAQSGLIDEYRLLVHPIALGRGLPVFSGFAAAVNLVLVRTTLFKVGAVARHRRAGLSAGKSLTTIPTSPPT